MCFVKTGREVVRFEVRDLTSGVLLCQLLCIFVFCYNNVCVNSVPIAKRNALAPQQ